MTPQHAVKVTLIIGCPKILGKQCSGSITAHKAHVRRLEQDLEIDACLGQDDSCLVLWTANLKGFPG